ncbi:hypothetical protein Tco_1152020 [Tanacetum coccineum]
MTKRCAQYEKDFAKLEAHCISLELKSQYKSSTSLQNGQVLKKRSEEAKNEFDTKDLDTINIELEYSVASLLKENEHLKKIYQNLFDSIKRSRVQTKSSNVTQNEAENLKSHLSEFADKKFDKVFKKIESMKQEKFMELRHRNRKEAKNGFMDMKTVFRKKLRRSSLMCDRRRTSTRSFTTPYAEHLIVVVVV